MPAATLTVPVSGAFAVNEIEIKRSQFITWIARADDDAAARELISKAKAEYPDARHHCSAFIYEVEGANRVERSSDDGEPSGTAGRPMLDVLAGSGVTNIAAVVVRYFGGVKLGTGGLVRAYGDSVSECLKKLPLASRVPRELRTVTVSAADGGRIEAELRNRGFVIVDTHWAAEATHTVAIEPGTHEELDSIIQALTHGAVAGTKAAGRQWVEVPR